MAFTFYKLAASSQYGNIFDEDASWLSECGNYINTDPSNTSDTLIHTDLYPEQVIGNPNNAKVFLLNLNPSFSPSNRSNQPMLHNYVVKAIGGNFSNCYPFFYLDPKIRNTDGGRWWVNGHHFRSWINLGYTESQLANTFCCLELFPYHCRRLPGYVIKNMHNCPSTKNVINFVVNEIIPKARNKEVVVIVLRSAKHWGIQEKNPSDNIFFSSNVQNANFSVRNEQLMDAITKLI